MFIKNVTTEDDPSNRNLGRYECWAFRNAADKRPEAKHGFSVDVILSEHACCFMSHCVDNVLRFFVTCLERRCTTYKSSVLPRICIVHIHVHCTALDVYCTHVHCAASDVLIFYKCTLYCLRCVNIVHIQILHIHCTASDV